MSIWSCKARSRKSQQETWGESILRDPSYNYGFLHRLDVPNSEPWHQKTA